MDHLQETRKEYKSLRNRRFTSSKWRKYCTPDVSIFSKAEMNRFYSPSDSDFDASKQASSNKNTKKPTLSWMRVFNNWKITHSYTEEIHTYQPEDLNPILEKLYAELRKTNGSDYEPACLRVHLTGKNYVSIFHFFLNKLGRPDYFSSTFTFF